MKVQHYYDFVNGIGMVNKRGVICCVYCDLWLSLLTI